MPMPGSCVFSNRIERADDIYVYMILTEEGSGEPVFNEGAVVEQNRRYRLSGCVALAAR